MPAVVATDPGPEGFHPNHPITTFLAKISPKPSMTPFTNGRSILMASEEKNAVTRVRVDSVGSKIARVAESGAGGGGAGCCREGEGVSVRSG